MKISHKESIFCEILYIITSFASTSMAAIITLVLNRLADFAFTVHNESAMTNVNIKCFSLKLFLNIRNLCALKTYLQIEGE